MPLYSVYAAITNMSPNKKVLGYSIREQLRDLMPSALLALALAAVTVPFLFIDMHEITRLVCQVVLLRHHRARKPRENVTGGAQSSTTGHVFPAFLLQVVSVSAPPGTPTTA